MRSKKTVVSTEAQAEGTVAVETPKKSRSSRSRKKPVQKTEDMPAPVAPEAPVADEVSSEVVAPVNTTVEAPATEAIETVAPAPETPTVEAPAKTDPEIIKERPVTETPAPQKKEEPQRKKPIPSIPKGLIIRDIVDLSQSMGRLQLLNDQQIQQLSLEEAQERCLFFEAILAQVLDYDIVLSDTNIWLELQLGHVSTHSDPRINARLAFERQLEFVSKLMKKKGGRFMMMAETYEEIDRFASLQEPTDYRDADWKDEILCRNVSARLAKRLILCQQRENRLRIEGIGSESHHSAFADPVIIRRVVELFSVGKKVLLLTNDASVSIRSLGMCDDLQRFNDIDDQTWNQCYAPCRPMTMSMEDLRLLDNITRQYHFLQQAAGSGWMQDVQPSAPRELAPVLQLNLEGFRPGDRADHQARREEKQRKDEQRAMEKVRAEERLRQQQEAQRQKEEARQKQQEQEELNRQRKEELRRQQQEQEELNRQRKEERRRQQQEQEERNRQRKEERRRKLQEQNANAEAVAEEPAANESVAAGEQSALAEQPVTSEKPAKAEKSAKAEKVELPVVDESAPEQKEQPAVVQKKQPAIVDAPVVTSTDAPEEAPTEGSANADEAPVFPAIPLPSFAPEDLDLITGGSEKKRRSHRGGGRRRPKGGE